MDEAPHGIVLKFLITQLTIREKAWDIYVMPQYRVQVAEGRSYVADLCVFAGDQPLPVALRTPPILCIEIVSPADGVSAMNEKIEEYLEAGVKVVWQIDPRRRKAYEIVNGEKTISLDQLGVPGTDILIETSEIFKGLNELEPGTWLKSVVDKQ